MPSAVHFALVLVLAASISVASGQEIPRSDLLKSDASEDRFEYLCRPSWLEWLNTDCVTKPDVGGAMQFVVMNISEKAAGATGCCVFERGLPVSFYMPDWFPIKTTRSRVSVRQKEAFTDAARAAVLPVFGELPRSPDVLPPMQRRLVVLWRGGDAWLRRVYDRANLPAQVTRLLVLLDLPTDPLIGAVVAQIPPERSFSVADARASLTTDLIVSPAPDGNTFVWIGGGTVEVRDASTGELRFSPPGQCMGWDCCGNFSPDGRFLVIPRNSGRQAVVWQTADWKQVAELSSPGDEEHLSHFEFSPDGGRLTAQLGPRLVSYDKATWREVGSTDVAPENTVWYRVGSPGGPLLVFQRGGHLLLWDAAHSRLVASLDEKCGLLSAKLSPDKQTVATITETSCKGDVAKHRYRLRLWDAQTGALRRELYPYEMGWITQERAEGVFLTWTQDSRYVIASNCGFFRRWIHLWNAQTGRHVADFATQSRLGTLTSVEGIGVGCGGRKLFAASADGRVLRWDLSDAVKAIGDLEAEVSGTVSAKTGKE